jgi:Ohr subfamily peroxiredoxin
MFSARAIFEEIFDHDEAFQLFCSIAARGEGQGGWENGRIAALVPGSQAELAPKISRHGADEDKHRRIFNALLRKRGLHPVPAPADTDYTMRLENAGIGLAHARLQPEQLFAVGYAACFQSALMGVARGRNLDASGSQITSRVDIGPTGHGGFGLAVWLDLHAPNLTAAQAADLMTRARERCPYSVATRGNIEVTIMVDGMPLVPTDTAAG